MKVFSRDVIENFAKPGNEKIADITSERACGVVYNALSDMAKINPFIDLESIEFIVVNEFVTGAYGPFSEFQLFVSLISPQLEFNTIKISDNPFKKFKNRLLLAWKNRKVKKKKKIKERKISSSELIAEGKYTMESFIIDLQDAMLTYLSSTCIVSITTNGLRILGRDEFGFKVSVSPVIKSGILKLYNLNTKTFQEVDFGDRISNLTKKIERVGDNFVSILRIFNSLYYNIYQSYLNQIYIESVLASVPDTLFSGKSYDSFIKILNYINLSDMSGTSSITNNKINIYNTKLNTVSRYAAQKFFKDISSRL